VKIQEAIGEKLGLCGFFMCQSVLFLVMAFVHGWKLTLVTLCSSPALAIASGKPNLTLIYLLSQVFTNYYQSQNYWRIPLSHLDSRKEPFFQKWIIPLHASSALTLRRDYPFLGKRDL